MSHLGVLPKHSPEQARAYMKALEQAVTERKRIEQEEVYAYKRRITDEFGFPVQRQR